MRPVLRPPSWGTLGTVLLAALLGGAVGGAVVWSLTQQAPLARPQPLPTPAVPHTPTPTRPPVTLLEESSTTRAVARVVPAVFTILRGDALEPEAVGTGVLIDPEGHVVTNAHVLEGARRLWVAAAGGDRRPVELVGRDEFADLAVLALETGEGLTPAEMADSSALVSGQRLIAVGSALGQYPNSVTSGVVSGLDRSLRVSPLRALEGLIQTDAAINRGNSGGPLVNLQGQVVGINTILVTDEVLTGQFVRAQGIGFAIPANTVRPVVEAILSHGEVLRPELGLTLEPAARSGALPGFSTLQGVEVVAVQAGGAAAEAGLLPGDLITHFDGVPLGLATSRPFFNLLYDHRRGDRVLLGGFREGKSHTWQVTLGGG